MVTKTEFNMLKEIETIKHENKMEEIEAERKARIDVEKLKHEQDKERQRIKGAEIRKSQERQSNRSFMENYHK